MQKVKLVARTIRLEERVKVRHLNTKAKLGENSFAVMETNLGIIVVLLLQSALQPLWVMACSTIAEYSQQEGRKDNCYVMKLDVAWSRCSACVQKASL